MPAYMVVTARVSDPARLQAYVQGAERLFSDHGAHLLARGTPGVLEGTWPWQGAVIFEWPSREHAERVWSSPDYAARHRLREGAAEFEVFVLDGCTPD